MGSVEIGMRVVRGPDWRWGDQDGGNGHAGTIVEIGRTASSTTPDRTVVVQWDAGSRTNYRTGYQNSHDLLLIDNAPSGVKHQNHICDCCKKQGIAGIRWQCLKCFDYDLCTSCYMADKHDVLHPFRRYVIITSKGMDVGTRRGLPKTPCKGIFVGAKVVRGQDWDWGNQDGGEGKLGRVTAIRGWDNESGRSVASATWSCGNTNVYRVGHKGKMDIKCIHPATSGNYYMQHLPIVGKNEEESSVTCSAAPSNQMPFLVGERVRIQVTLDQLKVMQEGHGGWNQKMAEIIDRVGVVHRITDKGDVRVQYEGFPNRWTIHPSALARVNVFMPGDVVTVLSDTNRVRELQKGHGEWIDYMKSALGKTGVIAKVYPDGDLRVNIEGKTWTFNPLCISLNQHNTEYNNTMKANERQDYTGPAAPLFVSEESQDSANSLVDQLVREAAQGHIDDVSLLLSNHKGIIDGRSAGKTCLQVACHQGHLDLARLLLLHNACIELPDDDGDTPLHYSAFGNQPEIMEILLRKGANINAINKGCCSALHVAVNKQHPACVSLLLKYNCDVNVQDSYGDTALHDAIGKDSVEILEMLGNFPHLNLMLKNKRGFNILHHAALKGNNFAAEKLVMRARQYVDIRKDDGFAALHLAALNGHKQVAETLLTAGRADANITNNKRQTPLLLAVSQGHFELLELLISHGVDVNLSDEDGETALHLALQRQMSNASHTEVSSLLYTKVITDLAAVGVEGTVSLAMACCLVQKGSNLTAVNNKTKTPVDLITDAAVIDVIQSYSQHASDLRLHGDDLRALDLATDSLRTETEGDDELGDARVAARLSVSQPVSPAHWTKDTLRDSSSRKEKENDNIVISNETDLCLICTENNCSVVFKPCEHCITCEDCASRVKKCLQCKEVIFSKATLDGRVLSSKTRLPSADKMEYLQTKIAEMEEAHNCSICMERSRNVAFMCGHGACVVCATPLKHCHMCRRQIARKINLY